MKTSFPEDTKQRFSGDLSKGENEVCANFRALLHAALSGRSTFKDAMRALREGLSGLREVNYDVDKAIASGRFHPKSPVIRNKKRVPPRLSSGEKSFLEDADGLIDWVTRNGVSFSVVFEVLGHDISELARDDFSLDKMLGPGRRVLPKVSGWARRNSEPVGEAEE